MSVHAGIDVVEIDAPEPIRDHARDISNATSNAQSSASAALTTWVALQGQYVDAGVGPTIHSAYDRPAAEAEALSSAGSLAATSLSTLADTYEALRTRRAALVEDLDQLAIDDAAGDEDKAEARKTRRAGLSAKAAALAADKEEADALCVVALGNIPSPTGAPRSRDASAGYYPGIEQKAGAGAEDVAQAQATAQEAAAGPYSHMGPAEFARQLPGKGATTWLGFKPPFGKDGTAWALYSLGRMNFALGVGLSTAKLSTYGRFHPNVKGFYETGMSKYLPHAPFGGPVRYWTPRNPLTGSTLRIPHLGMGASAMWNRFSFGLAPATAPQGASLLKRVRNWDTTSMFQAKKGRAETVAKIGKWSTAAKYGGMGLTAVGAGLEEYQRTDGAFSGRERAARVAVKSTAATVGSVAGGRVGGVVGGAIGSALIPIPGVGTVVGATAGSIVGGWVGGEAGKWAGDHLKQPISDFVKDPEGSMKNMGKGIEHFGGSVKDEAVSGIKKLKFW